MKLRCRLSTAAATDPFAFNESRACGYWRTREAAAGAQHRLLIHVIQIPP
jgi:hypothetical protein